MWPALSLDQILTRARLAADPADPLGERLISMVFAPPVHPVWTELRCTVARQVQLEHRRALELAGQSRSDRWRHTGGADLAANAVYDILKNIF